jgi:hypothetical protein
MCRVLNPGDLSIRYVVLGALNVLCKNKYSPSSWIFYSRIATTTTVAFPEHVPLRGAFGDAVRLDRCDR